MYIVWNVIAAILLCAAITFLIILIADLCIMGAPLLILARKAQIPEYLISTPNRIDAQEGLQCAGYSSAYLLRHFGQRAQGAELYAFAPCKQAVGVTSRGLRKSLISRGMCVSYRMGNLNALKNAVAQGAPVIVSILRYVRTSRGCTMYRWWAMTKSTSILQNPLRNMQTHRTPPTTVCWTMRSSSGFGTRPHSKCRCTAISFSSLHRAKINKNKIRDTLCIADFVIIIINKERITAPFRL